MLERLSSLLQQLLGGLLRGRFLGAHANKLQVLVLGIVGLEVLIDGN